MICIGSGAEDHRGYERGGTLYNRRDRPLAFCLFDSLSPTAASGDFDSDGLWHHRVAVPSKPHRVPPHPLIFYLPPTYKDICTHRFNIPGSRGTARTGAGAGAGAGTGAGTGTRSVPEHVRQVRVSLRVDRCFASSGIRFVLPTCALLGQGTRIRQSRIPVSLPCPNPEPQKKISRFAHLSGDIHALLS